ncbi:hypothetical protein ABZX88_23290 [Kitasatospora aureofaciens]|uniref:hypothetical protein n=1 Tax=Kitasatospora aureofaciens TaxID=1894 RepID=UPI0033B57BFB
MAKRILALAIGVAVLAGPAVAPVAEAAAPRPSTVTVDGRVTSTVPADAIGVNTPFSKSGSRTPTRTAARWRTPATASSTRRP